MSNESRDDKDARLGALGFVTGCLIIPIVVPVVVVVILLIWAALPPSRDWERAVVPESIELGATLVSDVATGLREGCALIAIELTEAEANRVAEGGLRYLANQRRGRAAARLESWRETPISTRDNPHHPGFRDPVTATGDPFYAGHLLPCSNDLSDPRIAAAQRAIAAPGAYYTSYNRGEGAIVLIPALRLIVLAYHG